MYSSLEFNTIKEALFSGYRSDNRKFEDPRDLKISFSQSPGFALVQLGKTMITARTMACLDVPPPSSPNRGQHIIKVYGPPFIRRSEIDTFQTTLRMIWRAINVLEEDTLCVKIGEKVWKLTTQVVINDRDGGLIDASIMAVYASLSQIYFPSFDTSTGNLYPPSQRRTHKVAFSIKPICITVALLNEKPKETIIKPKEIQNINNSEKDFDEDYFDAEEEEEEVSENDTKNENYNKTSNIDPSILQRTTQRSSFIQPKKIIIVDPTQIETDASSGFATFIITEHQEQVYLISKCPGNNDVIEKAREVAIAASLKWRKTIENEIQSFNKKTKLESLSCVGDPADFIDYKPHDSNLTNLNNVQTSTKNTLDNINEFKLWTGETKEKFVLDFFKLVDDKGSNDDSAMDKDTDGEDWLHSSLIA